MSSGPFCFFAVQSKTSMPTESTLSSKMATSIASTYPAVTKSSCTIDSCKIRSYHSRYCFSTVQLIICLCYDIAASTQICQINCMYKTFANAAQRTPFIASPLFICFRHHCKHNLQSLLQCSSQNLSLLSYQYYMRTRSSVS